MTLAVVAGMVSGKVDPTVMFMFMVGVVIALLVNYRDADVQRARIDAHAKAALMMASVLFAAGPNAVANARLALDVVRERLELTGVRAEDLRFEPVGVDAVHGASLSPAFEPYEVRARVAGRTASMRDAVRIGGEVEALYTCGPAGGGGVRRSAREVLAIGSLLLPRESVIPNIRYFEVQMKVGDIAHSRAGDKGDVSNVSVIAFALDDSPLLEQSLTAERVREHFAGVVRGEVVRYELPSIGALNFVMTRALGGGVTRSLRLDAHGKCLSSAILTLEVPPRGDEGNERS